MRKQNLLTELLHQIRHWKRRSKQICRLLLLMCFLSEYCTILCAGLFICLGTVYSMFGNKYASPGTMSRTDCGNSNRAYVVSF